MPSTISNYVSRENLAFDFANSLELTAARNQKVLSLHKELLEINLSVAAYIEESKKRLHGLRSTLAHEAKDSYKVVEIHCNKCKYFDMGRWVMFGADYDEKMFSPPSTPHKRYTRINIKSLQEDNNNTKNKFSERQQARTFIQWYKRMVDRERQNLGLYLSDDATLEWFGRTIKTRKKIASFLKYDMQCSGHDFTTVESIDKIQTREETGPRKEDTSTLASPLHSPEVKIKERPGKRRLLRSNCRSPEWAEGCKPDDELEPDEKKLKIELNPEQIHEKYQNPLKREYPTDESVISSQGDGILQKVKRKCITVTPPNKEIGQGDCMPSTSGTDSNKSHDALNAQLPKLAVECNGYIEFNRTRNSRSTDSMKWDRKCKVQISYSEDPLNVGEYIIWALRYSDESKCRRNLLAQFEEAAKEEEGKNV